MRGGDVHVALTLGKQKASFPKRSEAFSLSEVRLFNP
jgi:hypothetical protein